MDRNRVYELPELIQHDLDWMTEPIPIPKLK